MSLRGLALGAGLAGLIACGAAKMQSPTVAPARADGAPMDADHAEIERLSQDIDAKVGHHDVAPVSPTSMAMAATPMDEAPKSTDPSCHPAPTDTCSQSCTLADSICVDAKKICDIAVKLAGDQWAADRCNSGKQSCDTAHTTCCGCH